MAESNNNTQSNQEPKKGFKDLPIRIQKAIKFVGSLAIILILGFVILNYVPFIAKYNSYVVVTDSMEGVINVNDVVVIDSSYELSDIQPGEIIAFNVDLNGDGKKETVVHYLYSYDETTGEFQTIANGQTVPDDWNSTTLTEDDFSGKHVLKIASIGSFLRFASSTFGKVVLIIDVIAIYFIIELFTEEDKETKKEDNNEEVSDKDKK